MTAVAYSVALTAACLVNGRTIILHKLNQLVLREKTEVVSLLLREYEDSGGDWMWRTNASRCLTACFAAPGRCPWRRADCARNKAALAG
ncbi:MAG: hypothetical protein IPP45_14385 [Sphingomonadales bacterium]|nr:hypothetical protein [Sphingomonadales bacterium]